MLTSFPVSRAGTPVHKHAVYMRALTKEYVAAGREGRGFKGLAGGLQRFTLSAEGKGMTSEEIAHLLDAKALSQPKLGVLVGGGDLGAGQWTALERCV